MSINLNDCQKQAVTAFLRFLVDPEAVEFVIEGFAGTGKTTLVKHLIDNYDKYSVSASMLGAKLPEFSQIAVTATTRKAATVLAQSMGTDPLTIHSHLQLVLRNCYSTGGTYLSLASHAQVRENELIFIDEASFIDNEMKAHIKNQTRNCKIVYMGDPAQLINVKSSVSPIFGQGLRTTQLTEIMRHDGPISDLAAQYRNSVFTGKFLPPTVDGQQVRRVSPEDFGQEIQQAFTHQNYRADESAKVLAWTNNRVATYNEIISDLRGINDPLSPGEHVITNKPIIRPKSAEIVYSTDRVVKVLKAEPCVEKGIDGHLVTLQLGTQLFVPREHWKVKMLLKNLASKKEWQDYFYIKDHWGDLRPAYSSTVHKSQGSTYGKVFIDLTDIGTCRDADATARLLYVAVSRASKEVIMCGELPSHYMGETDVRVSA
ncbi:AAA family ATPase [Salinimonas marina]|uniref:AAA family ATPase n=1 Tax=Salinimonas marina TaxID=2785918 RepID=A0A7S9HE80_9ALTE|nr:AAA family ATPase [Salinimonas marina]QPG06935.1 AAA family ATPase [Salinimonas marina]